MAVTPNIARERMAPGKVTFAIGIRTSRSMDVIRAARAAGDHCSFIGLEHSVLGTETVGDLCVAGLESGVTPAVRTAGHDYEFAVRKSSTHPLPPETRRIEMESGTT